MALTGAKLFDKKDASWPFGFINWDGFPPAAYGW